ncbi:MAG: glycosyltransferase [Xenococcaceae cyanobacterium]
MDTNRGRVEHFCTLFDSNYLPMGMTLHQSLMNHARSFHLWIICMDELVEKQLQILSLANVSIIPIRDIETPELLAVKKERSKGEYCWTITPFTFQAVFDRASDIDRVTYLDADLFFFDTPQKLIQELEQSGKDVLITEHAYAPEYDRSLISGKFCVQFITFRKTSTAIQVMKWWQQRCLEWCFNRVENGKFGDQKYLDSWLLLFPNDIWIVQQKENTLAPWNVKFFTKGTLKNLKPVFYHFHGLKIVSVNKVLLYSNYKIGRQGSRFYQEYIQVLTHNLKIMRQHNFIIPCLSSPAKFHFYNWLKYFLKILAKQIQYQTIRLEILVDL